MTHKNRKYNIGDKFKTKYNDYMATVVDYDKETYFLEFEYPEKCIVKVHISNMVRGSFTTPYHRSVKGIGYFGEGPYAAKIDGKMTKEYDKWFQMIYRCHETKFHKKFPTYRDCYICEEWYNFQTFGGWCQLQIGFNSGWELDKDLLVKGNKEYHPDKCVFLPPELNTLLLKCDSRRGKYPLGISQEKNGIFRVQCMVNGKKECMARGYDIDKLFSIYKQEKEAEIKRLADLFRHQIDNRAYDALMCYNVEITD